MRIVYDVIIYYILPKFPVIIWLLIYYNNIKFQLYFETLSMSMLNKPYIYKLKH